MRLSLLCRPLSSHTHCFSHSLALGDFAKPYTLFISARPSFLLHSILLTTAQTYWHAALFFIVIMLLDLASLLLTASLASGVSIPQRDPDVLYARQTTGDPPFQNIPPTAKPDNTFNNTAALVGGIPSGDVTPPDVYGSRSIDLPFGRLYVRIFRHQSCFLFELLDLSS